MNRKLYIWKANGNNPDNYGMAVSDAMEAYAAEVFMDRIFQIVADRFGIKKVIKIVVGDEYYMANGGDIYRNRSYIIGHDEIHLGIYEDQELLIASFFHEIGHVLVKGAGSKIEIESQAWLKGLEIAEQYGYKFSDKVYEWAKEQISTYESSK